MSIWVILIEMAVFAAIPAALVGENTERFIEEVDKAHRHARQKKKKT